MTRFAPIALALFTVACDPGGTPDLESGCEESSRTAIDDRTAPIGGFVPADVIAAAVGDFAGSLDRDDASIGTIELAIVEAGGPDWVEYAEVDVGGIEPAFDCGPAMEMPVTLTLNSGTALAETLDATLVVVAADDVAIHASTDGETLTGDAEPLTLDTSTLDFLRFDVDMSLVDTEWDGEIGFSGQQTEGSGDDASVSLTFDPWATFTATR